MRNFTVDNKIYFVNGLSDNDPYFSQIEGDYDTTFKKFCKNFLSPNAVAIDVGANIGITSIILSHYLSQGLIYAIEPGKSIVKLLKENITLNNIKNIEVCDLAFSNESNLVDFTEDSAFGYIGERKISQQIEYKIQTSTIDNFVKEKCFSKLDFIKIDVEGLEWQVLEGGSESIHKFDPIIFIEFNSWCLLDHMNTNPIHFASYLLDNFKYVYRVNNSNSKKFLEKIDSARKLAHDNMVFNGAVEDFVLCNSPDKLPYSNLESL